MAVGAIHYNEGTRAMELAWHTRVIALMAPMEHSRSFVVFGGGLSAVISRVTGYPPTSSLLGGRRSGMVVGATSALWLVAELFVGHGRGGPAAVSRASSSHFALPGGLALALTALAGVVLLAALGVLAWVMLPGRGGEDPERRRRYESPVISWIERVGWTLVALAPVIGLMVALPYLGGSRAGLPPAPAMLGPGRARPPPNGSSHGASVAPDLTWLAFAGLGAALLLLLLAIVLVVARRRATTALSTAEDAAPEAVIESISAGVRDLASILEPRKAVIACYAHMESALATAGVGRLPHETPFELLTRMLRRWTVADASATRLTNHFERAMFSPKPVDEAARVDAIDALQAVQVELSRARGDGPYDPEAGNS